MHPFFILQKYEVSAHGTGIREGEGLRCLICAKERIDNTCKVKVE